MLTLALLGASGRVGRRLLALALDAPDLRVAAAVVSPESRALGEKATPTVYFSTELADARPDVVVDFSTPSALRAALAWCVERRVPLVSGTTGLSADDDAALNDAARAIPLLHATNTSLGVAVLNRLARDAATLLGDAYDVELVETHHKHKKDAPSGTARTLLRAVLDATGRSESDLQHGRVGDGARAKGSVGVHSLRVGDTVGTHTLVFGGDGERVELTHVATSRDTFAAGALRCARWIAGKSAGRYAIEDVLGLT